jgi:type IV secretion system protein VirD4
MRHPLASAIRLLLVLAVIAIAVSLVALGIRFQAVAVVLLAVAAYRKLRRFRGSGGAYGSARASGFSDLMAAGMLSSEHGLLMGDCGYLGRPSKAEGLRALCSPLPAPVAVRLFLAAWLGRRWAKDIPIRLPSFVHLGIFAPAGAGKGTSYVIPWLRSWRGGSIVCTDPKGENYLKSFKYRRKLGRVIRLDPFKLCGPGGQGMNPIALLPPPDADDFLNACRDLANALIFRTGKEDNPHWNDRAEDVLCAIIVFIAAVEKNPKLRNLASVRRIVANEEALLATVNLMRTRCTGVVKDQGDQLSSLKPGNEEFYGVMSTVARQTHWLASPAVADCLSRNDFNPLDLRSGRASLFLVLPPPRLETLAPLMRVWITATMSKLSEGEASEKHQILFICDEAAHLGRLRWLETGLTLLRGYGIRVCLILQSLGQLKEVYGEKDQVILDNLGSQLYFGITSYESAEAVSKRIGEQTVTVVSEGTSESDSMPTGGPAREPQAGNRSTSSSRTVSEHGRRWATADEILTMPSNMMLLMHNNMHVTLTRKIRYYASPLFRWGRAGRNPGLGLSGMLASACLCVAALVLSIAVADPPLLASLPLRRPAAMQAWQAAAMSALPVRLLPAAPETDASIPPAPARIDRTPRGNLRGRVYPGGGRGLGTMPRRRRNGPMPGYSGFLIPIR